jgi:hypothetical protein
MLRPNPRENIMIPSVYKLPIASKSNSAAPVTPEQIESLPAPLTAKQRRAEDYEAGWLEYQEEAELSLLTESIDNQNHREFMNSERAYG